MERNVQVGMSNYEMTSRALSMREAFPFEKKPPVFVTSVEELHHAVRDPENVGKLIQIKPGTHLREPAELIGEDEPIERAELVSSP